MPTARRPLQFQIVTLPPGFPDFALRVGDAVPKPDGGVDVVVLLIGPRQLISRPPVWWDLAWMPFACIIDRWRLGPQPGSG